MSTLPHTDSLDRPATRRWRLAAAIILILTNVFTATVQAQQVSGTPPAAGALGAAGTAQTSAIQLLVGRSTILRTRLPIARVSLTTPDIADALVTSPQQLLIHGKAPGTISLFVWDRTGGIETYDVVVERDLSLLGGQFRQLFPGEPIAVSSNGTDIVLSGTVSSSYVVEKAAAVAGGYITGSGNVVNLLAQREGEASNQVLLRVRFAEVSRTALQELGASFFSDGQEDVFGRVTTQQFPAPIFDQRSPMLGQTLQFSDFLNLFLFDAQSQLGAVITALQTRGLFQSLAEPNLIAMNGREASFLAGGEYPYPAVQGSGATLAVTVEFKEFGIRLNFTPTIVGDDMIHLKVAPEVSALDFANAVSLQGFTIPALSTRRAETEVELRDGQTFAIAGLLNNSVTESMQKIPGIGDIPILGRLFQSRALQRAQTELVVMITPQIVRRDSVGVAPRLPDLVQPFMEPPRETTPPPAPTVAPGASAAPTAPSARPAAAVPAPAVPAASAVPPPPVPAAVVESGPSAEGSAAHDGAVSALEAGGPEEAPPLPLAMTDAPAPELTPQEWQAFEDAHARARLELEKERIAEARRYAAEVLAARKQAEEDRKRMEAERQREERETRARAAQEARLAREQAQREEREARAREEEERRQAETERRRAAALAEAEARLRAAQASYQEELERLGVRARD